MRIDVILARAVRSNVRAFVLIALCVEFALCGISIYQTRGAYLRLASARRTGAFDARWREGEPVLLRGFPLDRPYVVFDTGAAAGADRCVHVGRALVASPLAFAAFPNATYAWDGAQWRSRTPCNATSTAEYATPDSFAPRDTSAVATTPARCTP
jgi:hypothetical protein